MYELREEDLAKALRLGVNLDDQVLPIWPANQSITRVAEPRIFGTWFADSDLIRRTLTDRVVRRAASLSRNLPGLGGQKVRDHEFWDSLPARLLTTRAMLLFCHSFGATSAHVVDRWANVMKTHDYSGPHSHYDAEGAVVYSLEVGDPDPQDPMAGALAFLDARIPFCCSTHPEHPTRSLVPQMAPGAMLVFPGRLVHYVSPYRGLRPRITFAWNICAGAAPLDYREKMSQQVDGEIGMADDVADSC